MRINKYVALATGLGRRKVDSLIKESRIKVDGNIAVTGQDVSTQQEVSLDNQLLSELDTSHLIMLNKPVGYVVSRDGQGSPSVYELLPKEYSKLKPIGRLDKDSRGLLLFSNDGNLVQKLTHPSFNKKKIYSLKLNKKLTEQDKSKIEQGIRLDDGISSLALDKGDSTDIIVSMTEGRNRQIRRTFEALGYKVVDLNRVALSDYIIGDLAAGDYKEVTP